MPRYDLPYTTQLGVSVNLAQLSPQGNPIGEVVVPGSNQAPKGLAPLITSITVDFDTQGAFIKLGVKNLPNLPANPNLPTSTIDELYADIKFGDELYREYDLAPTPVNQTGLYQVKLRLPNFIPYSESVDISLVRALESNEIVEEFSSQKVPLTLKHFDRVLAADPISGSVKVINADNAAQIVQQSGSPNLLLASIPLGINSVPRYITALEDRVYVPLEGDSSVAVIDAIGLRELDANPDTSVVDRIKLPSGSSPSSIVLGEKGRFAYVGDRNSGMIYVVDIDPKSQSYNTYLQTIEIPGVKRINRMSLRRFSKTKLPV